MASGRRTIGILGVAAAAALAAASSGNAGGPIGGSGLWVCGPHHAAHLTGAIEQKVPVQYKTGLQAAAPAPPQAFYRVDLNASTTCAVNMVPGQPAYFIPAAGEVRVVGTADHAFWVKLAPDVAAKLRKAVGNVKPYRAPTTLTSVSVNDRSVAHPSTYLRLYRIGRPIKTAPNGIHWLYISLLGVSPESPWTDGRNALWVSRRGHDYLKRDGQTVRIPASVAARIRRAAPIPK
jgi:hypothetical protein